MTLAEARGRRRGAGRGDAGQVVTAVLVLVALGLLVVAVSIVLPLGRATDLRGGAQTAADAAALAGAQDVKERFLDLISGDVPDRPALTSWMVCGAGAGRATTLAAANDARIVQYCYRSGPDRVVVGVEGRTDLDGQRPQAQAQASVGVRWGSCRWRPDTGPGPAPAPGPAPGPGPGPAARVVFDCGSFEVPFVVDPGDGHLTADVRDLAALERALEPRLER